jgi:hypothetical protein
MKIISGGQTGVDRAALDAAIAHGIAYGGWCPRGGWAEDFPDPPGLLANYPQLKETPLADPAQRTEWNVRDSDATLILVGRAGVAVSKGTGLAAEFAQRYGKPVRVVDVAADEAAAITTAWLEGLVAQLGDHLVLGIGGPRESEVPSIYARARALLDSVLARAPFAVSAADRRSGSGP